MLAGEVLEMACLSVCPQFPYSCLLLFCLFGEVMCNSDSGIGTGIVIPGIFRAYGIGIRIESKAKITWWNWNRNRAYIYKDGIGIGIESKGFARNQN